MSNLRGMKVFYWEGVLVDCTSGIMVAVARNVDEARAALLKECDYLPKSDLNQEPKVFDLSEPRAFYVYGGR